MSTAVIRDLIEGVEHALKVFRSLADRGYYPQELLPDDADGKPSDLFLGKQGMMFLLDPLKRAQSYLEGQWISWHGGACPVPAGTLVQYKMRRSEVPDDELDICDAMDLDWEHGDRSSLLSKGAEIIAYRLIKEEVQAPISAWVGDMKTSKGMEYYVCVGRKGASPFDKTYLTPNMYRQRGRAEYDVACWNAMLNGTEEPDIMDYDTDTIG